MNKFPNSSFSYQKGFNNTDYFCLSYLRDTYKTKLKRKFTAKNFIESMNFLNKVAAISEHEGHHPDLHLTSYRDVEIVLWTHKADGLTKNDFILAKLIDTNAKVFYSPVK